MHLGQRNVAVGVGITNQEYSKNMAVNPRPLLADEVHSDGSGMYVCSAGGFRCADVAAAADMPRALTRAPKDIESQSLNSTVKFGEPRCARPAPRYKPLPSSQRWITSATSRLLRSIISM
ncbi:MAG: hypothetical protein AB7I34_02825 [Rhizobiaceae bacterium]